jgi:hypothetical protein
MKWAWLSGFSIVLLWSGIEPHDQFTWFLEVLPAVVGLGAMVASFKGFPLTPMLYGLILLHCWILMVGVIIHMLTCRCLIGYATRVGKIGTTTIKWGILRKALYQLSSQERYSFD